tara:strand:- start:37 stop:318 length:282 start_codon:yes stop_codon:yes gene_type:complete
MKKQINDLLLKMQSGETCIGETANKLFDLKEGLKRKYAIIDFRNMDFMQNEEGKINYYDTMDEARLTCAIYEFENVWVVELVYNYIEDKLEDI